MDPVPARLLAELQKISGDRVHLPDLKICLGQTEIKGLPLFQSCHSHPTVSFDSVPFCPLSLISRKQH